MKAVQRLDLKSSLFMVSQLSTRKVISVHIPSGKHLRRKLNGWKSISLNTHRREERRFEID